MPRRDGRVLSLQRLQLLEIVRAGWLSIARMCHGFCPICFPTSILVYGACSDLYALVALRLLIDLLSFPL